MTEKKRKRKKKKKEKNVVFSGNYVIASSLPSERQRPNDDRWNAARSCQYLQDILSVEDDDDEVVVPNIC